MGSSGLKRKSKKSDDVSSQRKKKKKKTGLRKDSKKRRRIEPSVSSHSTGDLSDSEYTSSSSTSLSGYKRKRTKSKKHHRAKSSISSYSDISLSTGSDSLSSDVKTHKGREGREARIPLKSKKRITRKRYSSSDDGTYAKHPRKRKRTGKDLSLKSRKKSSKKKSRKKLSSDSEIYSTCPSGERSEGDEHSRKATRDKKIGSDISYKGRKRRKMRSLSCSSRSRGRSDEDRVRVSQNDDALALLGNNPRRLRSVICIPDRTFDELEKDLNKEVSVHDRDDYPSPKSFGGGDEQNKGEPDDHSRRESIEKFHVENYVTKLTNSSNDGGQISKEDSARIRDFDKEIDSSASIETSGGDLELTLRQKALENLMKFRGGRKGLTAESHGKPNNEIDVINESKNTESSAATEVEQTSGPTSNEEFSQPMELPEGPRLEERRNESNNGSEFEEKTMSVMRGGEMVEVSYKVRIPNKTSRLARRQLRR